MGFLNAVSKILFGSLAGEGRKREKPEKVSSAGINPLVRNCDGNHDEYHDEYEKRDYETQYGKRGGNSCGASCLARDFVMR